MQIVSETICMKCQILFAGENKKNTINLSSAELAQRMVKVNLIILGKSARQKTTFWKIG